HCAIHQCLRNVNRKDVNNVFITCSGGPFWGKKLIDLENVSIKDAKNHPIWDMGEKNLIDSASLMNKALEIIEARWLFDLDPKQIKVLIHPQSIVHAIVENIDGSSLASLSSPDMKICIAYGLGYPDKINSFSKPLNLIENSKLEFFDYKVSDFPSIDFAYRALNGDESIPVALNSANEIAVSYFLNNKIKFNSIFTAVDYTMNIFEGRKSQINLNVEDLLEIDKEAKSLASDFLN
ncbi:MAG: 1-deoxy-D-xylulose-5-phosphate reductoisomerase, partial [Pseudomonadota bacterium]|nr:1-deoxy-D-xylulose-5-phosphate reductoisomerase [Pseudomonadota bacterium]